MDDQFLNLGPQVKKFTMVNRHMYINNYLEYLPTCVSISNIFSILDASIKREVILFSTASTTPSAVLSPIAVDPSLMASMAYSTWNILPSGENVLTPRSYSDLVINMASFVFLSDFQQCVHQTSDESNFYYTPAGHSIVKKRINVGVN